MIKVSIIIPAYNAEDYIERCIQSALHQTMQDLEIIIVDDGSTDSTYQLCKSIDDDRIILLQQENAGPAAARNKGLAVATGEYIGFMDSDDYADSRMFEILYRIAKKENADVVNCSHRKVGEDYSPDNNSGGSILEEEIITYSDIELQKLVKAANANRILWFAWKGLYRRSMIQEHNILFPEYLKLGEETPFVLECLLCSKIIAATECKLYYYVQRQGSLTKTKHKEGYFERLNALYIEKKAVYSRYGFNGYETDLNRYTMEHTLPMIISNELNSGKAKASQRQSFREMRDTEMITEAFKNVNVRVIHSKLRYLAILLKYRQYTLLALLCK